jgi:hypothetical protein
MNKTISLTKGILSERTALLFSATALILLLAGCGYSTHSLIRKDIQSIAIPVFDNDTRYRGLEVDLTNALIEEVKLHTSLQIRDQQSAESTLTGSIVSYEDDIATETEDEAVLLRRGRVTVVFSWTDNRTGQDILSEEEVHESETFAVERAEPISQKLFQETAQQIIQRLKQDW